MFQVIATAEAPKAVGPYSQAVKYNGMVFVSGQIPINPATGELVTGPIADQTTRVIKNLQAILEEAGSDLSKVIKTTVYLKDMNDYEVVNKTYGEHFTAVKPARVCVQVARLPKDVSIEIDAIAAV
ncbi:MAG TPA: RidA family protein [Chroococcales cyanobacterium]